MTMTIKIILVMFIMKIFAILGIKMKIEDENVSNSKSIEEISKVDLFFLLSNSILIINYLSMCYYILLFCGTVYRIIFNFYRVINIYNVKKVLLTYKNSYSK